MGTLGPSRYVIIAVYFEQLMYMLAINSSPVSKVGVLFSCYFNIYFYESVTYFAYGPHSYDGCPISCFYLPSFQIRFPASTPCTYKYSLMLKLRPTLFIEKTFVRRTAPPRRQ